MTQREGDVGGPPSSPRVAQDGAPPREARTVRSGTSVLGRKRTPPPPAKRAVRKTQRAPWDNQTSVAPPKRVPSLWSGPRDAQETRVGRSSPVKADGRPRWSFDPPEPVPMTVMGLSPRSRLYTQPFARRHVHTRESRKDDGASGTEQRTPPRARTSLARERPETRASPLRRSQSSATTASPRSSFRRTQSSLDASSPRRAQSAHEPSRSAASHDERVRPATSAARRAPRPVRARRSKSSQGQRQSEPRVRSIVDRAPGIAHEEWRFRLEQLHAMHEDVPRAEEDARPLPDLARPDAAASSAVTVSRQRVRRRKSAKKAAAAPTPPGDAASSAAATPRTKRVRRRKVRKARKGAPPADGEERRPMSAAVTMRRLRHRARADRIRDVNASVRHEQLVYREALRDAQSRRANAEDGSALAARLDAAIGEMEAHLRAMDTFLRKAEERERAAERRAANAGAVGEEGNEDEDEDEDEEDGTRLTAETVMRRLRHAAPLPLTEEMARDRQLALHNTNWK